MFLIQQRRNIFFFQYFLPVTHPIKNMVKYCFRICCCCFHLNEHHKGRVGPLLLALRFSLRTHSSCKAWVSVQQRCFRPLVLLSLSRAWKAYSKIILQSKTETVCPKMPSLCSHQCNQQSSGIYKSHRKLTYNSDFFLGVEYLAYTGDLTAIA